MTDVYTQTLVSGHVLTVSPEVAFGEVIIAGGLLVLLSVAALDFAYQVFYERHS